MRISNPLQSSLIRSLPLRTLWPLIRLPMSLVMWLMTCLLFILSPMALAQGLLQKAQESRQMDAAPVAGGIFTSGGQPKQGLTRAGELQAALIAERTAIVPGEKILLGLRLVHDAHWHTYWRNPGDSGLPTTIEWSFPSTAASPASGWKAGEIQWPTPKRLPVGPLANFGFEDEVVLPVEIAVPRNLVPGTRAEIVAQANWLICKDVCIPGGALLSITLPVVANAQDAQPSADASRFAQAKSRLPVSDTSRRVSAYLQEKSLVLAWPRSAPDAQELPGYFYPYTEALISPFPGQRLSKTAQGYRLDIVLGESPRAALEDVRRLREVAGVWAAGNSAVEWRATLQQGDPPAATELISAGKSAAEEKPSTTREFNANALLLAIVGALIGGAILNLMPCVFPVIGLKVLSFAQSAHSRAESLKHALIFSLGIVVSFLALAALLIGLRAAGEAVGWGFQLQSPLVVLLLALLFVGIALNLAGVFEMGLMATRLGNLEFANRQSGSAATFSSGVLAVVVASPCTAPFMGSAVGFTASAGIAETLLVFAALGVGMALPYLLLSSWPALLSRLPRPGPWMVHFRQAMAFPMLAAAAWLFWVLASLQSANVVLSSLIAAIAMAMVLWIYGTYVQARKAGIGSVVFILLGLGLLAWSMNEAIKPQALSTAPISSLSTSSSLVGSAEPAVNSATNSAVNSTATTSAASNSAGNSLVADWQPWAPGLPERLQAQGKTVFVDFTATWCISCQANKVRVLQNSTIISAFQNAGVVLLRADWTRKDETIARELERHGRNGVPLYLVYAKTGGQPKILSEWLTDSEVLNAIR